MMEISIEEANVDANHNDALQILASYIEPIGLQHFCKSLLMAVKEVKDFCRAVQNDSLDNYIKKPSTTDQNLLNGWTLPDAIWVSICQDVPALNLYPLGEIAERSFKKVIVTLSCFGDGREKSSPNVGLNTLQTNLRNYIKEEKVEGVLGLFLTYYIFEICMDYLRRSSSGDEDDFSYIYHFPDENNASSLSDERAFRKDILENSKEASGQLLDNLIESMNENNIELTGNHLYDHYCNIIEIEPEQTRPMPSNKPILNVIVGRKSTANLRQHFRLTPDTIRLLIDPSKGSNVTIHFQSIEKEIEKYRASRGSPKTSHIDGADKKPTQSLHSLSKDLLEIGTIIYMADQLVKRADHLGRNLDIWMPVRHVELWEENHDQLAQTVSFLGRDMVNFYFTKHAEDPEPLVFTETDGDENRCVCLLSGGLDSATGAVRAIKEGEKPIFVSHYANPYIHRLQEELVNKIYPTQKNSPTHISVFIGKSKAKRVPYPLSAAPSSPMKQFLRSFLYLSTAAAVALETGCRKIYMFENGPIALNPMFSEARVSTRTAHPRFMELFQTLVNSVSGQKISIENPFLYYTKGEVIAHLAKYKTERLVGNTISCWNWFNVPFLAKLMDKEYIGRHDGDCLPCVIRRAATDHANIEDVEYLIDVFEEFPDLRVDRKILIADYLRFCVNISYMSDAELLLACPDFSVYSDGIEPQRLAEMYMRHSNEMIEAFRTRSTDDIKQLVIPNI